MKPSIRFDINTILFDLSNSYVKKYNEKCYRNCGVGAQYNYNYEVINMIKLLPYEIVLLVENH